MQHAHDQFSFTKKVHRYNFKFPTSIEHRKYFKYFIEQIKKGGRCHRCVSVAFFTVTLVSVLGGVVLGGHHQTTPLPRTAVDGLHDVDKLLDTIN